MDLSLTKYCIWQIFMVSLTQGVLKVQTSILNALLQRPLLILIKNKYIGHWGGHSACWQRENFENQSNRFGAIKRNTFSNSLVTVTLTFDLYPFWIYWQLHNMFYYNLCKSSYILIIGSSVIVMGLISSRWINRFSAWHGR